MWRIPPPPRGAPTSSGPLVPACLGGEGGRLASAACVHLPHQRRLIPIVETFSPLAKPPEFTLGERYVQVPAATMCVAHTFEVVRKEKVTAIVRQGNIDPVFRLLVYRRSDPEPRTYLHLRNGVGVLLRLLISPAALHLGSWEGAYCLWECCQGLAAGRCRWRLGTVWRYDPSWEGDQFRTKIIFHESPMQDLEVFHLT